MTEEHRQRIKSFYHARVRSMCLVIMHTTIKYHKELLGRLNIRDISFYYNNRIIRWIVCHVSS